MEPTVDSVTRTTFNVDESISDTKREMIAPADCSNVLFMLNGMTR